MGQSRYSRTDYGEPPTPDVVRVLAAIRKRQAIEEELGAAHEPERLPRWFAFQR